eukprot:COSAG03_NODE_9346_length_727_cov_1.222930_2_plen_22_part_01
MEKMDSIRAFETDADADADAET